MKIKQMILVDIKSINMRNVVTIFIDHKYYPINAMYLFFFWVKNAMYLFNWSKTYLNIYIITIKSKIPIL